MSNPIDVVRMLHISAIDQLALIDDLFNVSLKMIFFSSLNKQPSFTIINVVSNFSSYS